MRAKGGANPDPPSARHRGVVAQSHVSMAFPWKRGSGASQTEGPYKAKLSKTMAELLLKQLLDRTADKSSVAR